MSVSLLLLGLVAVGLVLAFRGVARRTCSTGPRPGGALLGGGVFAAALGLAGLLFLHGPWHGHGGMGPHGMRGGMMGSGMMAPGGPARGIPAEALPEPDAEGARLLVRYCGACHVLPDPAARTAAEWPAVVARMRGHMADRAYPAPTDAEAGALLAYLARHAGGR